MAHMRETGVIPPNDGKVDWVISPEALSGLSLPTPRLWERRALIADVQDQEVGVGVYALPPKEGFASKFWSALRLRRGQAASAARLQIEPPVRMTDFRKGDHTRLSAIHPYFVMEDETQYGVGVWVPRGLYGDWSEPEERKDSSLFGDREVFQRRNVPALLIRVDGEIPLAESVSPTGRRSEVLIGVSEPQEGQQGDVLTVVTKRQVIGAGGKAGKADVSDLTFNVIAERGSDANAVIDDKGLVQVVLVHATEERVIEKISGTKIIGHTDSGNTDWGSLRYIDMGPGSSDVPKGVGA